PARLEARSGSGAQRAGAPSSRSLPPECVLVCPPAAAQTHGDTADAPPMVAASVFDGAYVLVLEASDTVRHAINRRRVRGAVLAGGESLQHAASPDAHLSGAAPPCPARQTSMIADRAALRLELRCARRGKLPRRRAAPCCVGTSPRPARQTSMAQSRAAASMGLCRVRGSEAGTSVPVPRTCLVRCAGHTGACRSPSPGRVSSARPDVTKQY